MSDYQAKRIDELIDENKYLRSTIRELRGSLDAATMEVMKADKLVYETVIKPRLELEDLISSYNGGIFDDARRDRTQALKYAASYLPKDHPTLEKYAADLRREGL